MGPAPDARGEKLGLYVGAAETAVIGTVEADVAPRRSKSRYRADCRVLGVQAVVNNVETLAHAPYTRGHGAPATRPYSLSGFAWRTGSYELPLSTPFDSNRAHTGAPRYRRRHTRRYRSPGEPVLHPTGVRPAQPDRLDGYGWSRVPWAGSARNMNPGSRPANTRFLPPASLSRRASPPTQCTSSNRFGAAAG